MKLGVVLAQFPSLSETFISRELAGLRELGFEITVYALSRPPEAESRLADDWGFPIVYRQRCPLAAVTTHTGALILPIADRFLSGEGAVSNERLLDLRHVPTALAWATDMQRRGIEWVHGHFAYVPSMVALLAARVAGLPFSFSAHAWDLWCTRDDTLLVTLLEECRFVAVCSSYGRDYLLQRVDGRFAERVHLQYHGLQLDDYPFRTNPPPAPATIVAVGRLVFKKGLADLIEALALLRRQPNSPPCSCEIIGDGPLRRELAQQIADCHLNECVNMTGALPHSEVIQHLQQATVCAVPSRIAPDGDRDGLPNVILEAAALGVPLVATQVAAIPEFVTPHGTGLLVPAGQPAALSRALHETLTNPQSAHDRAVRARQEVESHFELRANVARLASLFSHHTSEAAP